MPIAYTAIYKYCNPQAWHAHTHTHTHTHIYIYIYIYIYIAQLRSRNACQTTQKQLKSSPLNMTMTVSCYCIVASHVGSPCLQMMQVTGRFVKPRSPYYGTRMSKSPSLTTVFVAFCTPHLSTNGSAARASSADAMETGDADTMTFRSLHFLDMKYAKIEAKWGAPHRIWICFPFTA